VVFQERKEPDFVSVVVADNTRIHTQLLADAINKDHGLQVVATASNSSDLLAASERVPIDVVILSYDLDNQPARGTLVLRELRALRPQIKAVMLLDSSQPDATLDCFRAGAKGIFSKDGRLETLCKCIRTVHDGQIWARSAELEHVLQTLVNSPRIVATNQKGIELLSARERQVIECMAGGMTNREIAQVLRLSPHTIKNYLSRIFDKVGASSRTELLYLTMHHAQDDPVSSSDPRKVSTLEAAEAGDPCAQLRLADYHSQPDNPEHNPVSAYMWYIVAAKLAAPMLHEIEEGRARLAHTLSPQQKMEADQRAAQWIKRREEAGRIHCAQPEREQRRERAS